MPVVGDDFTGLAFPLGWDWRRLSWLLGCRWLHSNFPRFDHRVARFVHRLDGVMAEHEPDRADVLRLLLEAVLAAGADKGAAIVAPFEPAIAANRERGELSRFFVAAIASLADRAAPHPIVTAAERCGWSPIPDAFADLVVEFAILLQYWRDGDSIQLEPLDDDGEPGSPDGPEAPFDEQSDGPYRRTPRPSRSDTSADLERTIVAQLLRLATEDTASAGVAAANGPTRAEVNRSPRGPSALGTVMRRHDYYLRILAVMDHHNPATGRLYAAYADTCDPVHRDSVEQAVLAAFADAPSDRRIYALLGAATRRWVAGDEAGCARLATAAFAALDPDRDRDAASFAAGAIVLATARRDPWAAHPWALRVAALNDREHPLARIGVAEALVELCEARGDSLGRTRAAATLDALAAEYAPEVPRARVGRAFAMEPEAPVFRRFEDVAADLGEGRLAGAYERLCVKLGDLVETRPLPDVLDRLRADLAQVSAAIDRVPGRLPDVHEASVAATIAAWLCGAIAELYAGEGDEARWEEFKRRQFELQDEYAAAPEPEVPDARGGGDDRDDRFERLIRCIGAECRGRGAARRIEQEIARAIADAEEALADGRVRQARFWAARAEVLRARSRGAGPGRPP
jgi:hypothetical protein